MSERRKYTIRPLSRPARSDLRDLFRVYFSAAALLSLKSNPGDLCQIDTGNGKLRTAIAWSATEKLQETIVQTSKALQDIYGINLGDKVDITRYSGTAPEATNIFLQVDSSTTIPDETDQPGHEKPHWEWFLEAPLSQANWLAAGMIFDTVLKGKNRRFKIIRIESDETTESTIFKFHERTSIHIIGPGDAAATKDDQKSISFALDRKAIGGLHRQINQISRSLRRFDPTNTAVELPEYYKPPRGLLIYGPKGTGKSLLVDSVAKCSWRKLCRVESSGTREAMANNIQKVFSDAKKAQPSIIVIEQLDTLAPKKSSYDQSTASGVAAALRKGFDSLSDSNVLVVAEVRHPNEIEETLRAPTRFGLEVEITVPTADERLEILRVIRGDSSQPSDEALRVLSQRTHGYVGADLVALLNLCVELAEDRMIKDLATPSSKQEENASPTIQETTDKLNGENTAMKDASMPLEITEPDVTQALTVIRPTALQEIFLSTPHTPWSSIGGYDNIKRHLQNTVSRPLRFPEQMSRYNLRPRKGLLLYGPPGCSKTLLVKALATESGLNFLAVKGAEILSMYVGESERAVREIFRKARAASPSIIFFDEIDAIASTRNSSGGGASGVNVLTTLLNELDGIEELRNVLVVAATNSPQNVDPALLRPGRLDNLLYVGLPDQDTRAEILTNWLAKSRTADELKLPDVIARLAENLGGYSGAEIVGICETAGGFAMDRLESGLSSSNDPATTSIISPSDPVAKDDVVIEYRDLEEAAHRTRRGVSIESVHAFEEWSKGRG